MTTIESKMKQLRLRGMLKNWEAMKETRSIHELSFSDGLELLLHAEEEERKNLQKKKDQSLWSSLRKASDLVDKQEG